MPDAIPKPDRSTRKTSPLPREGRSEAPEPVRAVGIFSRLGALLGGRDDPERQRRRVLREYARRVAKARPRLYNHRSGTADAAMGEVFHSFYRVLGPARILLRNASASKVLKTIAVERALGERQREILRSLSAESLAALAKGKEGPELLEGVRGLLKELAGGFDKRTVERARRAHRAVLVLSDLVNYDYWSILRRFDSRYPEADFTYAPRFLPLDADYVGDALKDFLDVLSPVAPDLDWAQALDILREFRGMELVGAEAWRGLLRGIGELKKGGLLLAIVRLIDGDPTYAPHARAPEVKLIEPYLAAVRGQAETVVRQLSEAKRLESMAALARELFGDKDPPGLVNFTVDADGRFARKGLAGFANALALGYAKAYLIEVHKTAVKQTVDALLIRGAWRETSLSRSLSDSYQETLAVLNELLEFDRKLGPNQEGGVKLKAALTRADRARPPTVPAARQLVDALDKTAKGFLTRVAQGCVSLGQVLKALVEDGGRANPELISNWPELGGHGQDVRAQLLGCYRKLQVFLQLLKLSLVRPPSVAPASEGEQSVPSEIAPSASG